MAVPEALQGVLQNKSGIKMKRKTSRAAQAKRSNLLQSMSLAWGVTVSRTSATRFGLKGSCLGALRRLRRSLSQEITLISLVRLFVFYMRF